MKVGIVVFATLKDKIYQSDKGQVLQNYKICISFDFNHQIVTLF